MTTTPEEQRMQAVVRSALPRLVAEVRMMVAEVEAAGDDAFYRPELVDTIDNVAEAVDALSRYDWDEDR